MQYIDLENDTLLPVQEHCRRRLGKRVAPATIWRWIRKGAQGSRLEAVRIAGTWHTTSRAFAAFLLSRSSDVIASPDDSGAERETRRSAEMEQWLRAAGLL
jgi:hypothetical protein